MGTGAGETMGKGYETSGSGRPGVCSVRFMTAEPGHATRWQKKPTSAFTSYLELYPEKGVSGLDPSRAIEGGSSADDPRLHEESSNFWKVL